MDTTRDHKKLRVFGLADSLVVDVYRATRGFPDEERFGLRAQIRRAAVSVPTNIVEGSARITSAEYCRFLNIATASAAEAQYLLELSVRLEMLSVIDTSPLVERYTVLVKSLKRLLVGIAEANVARCCRRWYEAMAGLPPTAHRLPPTAARQVRPSDSPPTTPH